MFYTLAPCPFYLTELTYVGAPTGESANFISLSNGAGRGFPAGVFNLGQDRCVAHVLSFFHSCPEPAGQPYSRPKITLAERRQLFNIRCRHTRFFNRVGSGRPFRPTPGYADSVQVAEESLHTQKGKGWGGVGA